MKLNSCYSVVIVVGLLGAVLSACGDSSRVAMRPQQAETIIRSGTLQIGTSLGDTPPIPFTLVID